MRNVGLLLRITAAAMVVVNAATAELPPTPFHSAVPTVRATHSIPLGGLPITHLEADLERPYLYAITEDAGVARLLVINAGNFAIEYDLAVGSGVTDIDIHYGEARLYIANHQHPETQVVDLDAMTVLAPLDLATDLERLEAGRAGRLHLVDRTGFERLWLCDTTTGTMIMNYTDQADPEDIEVGPRARFLYVAEEGSTGSRLRKFDISGDAPYQVAAGAADPYGSVNLVLTADGSRLFWMGFAYDTDLVKLFDLSDEILTATLRGDLVFSAVRAYDGHTGEPVAYLPTYSDVQAVSGDQQSLFLYDAAGDAIAVVALADIAPVPPLAVLPDPADGSTVSAALAELAWTVMPYAQAYDVYLGTDPAAVAGAGPSSPEYLGRVSDLGIAIAGTLEPARAYAWRVDPVGAAVHAGPVWTFTTASITAAPAAVEVIGIVHTSAADVTLDLTAAAAEGFAVASDAPWLSPSPSAGTTPATVALAFDLTGLGAGRREANLQVSGGATSFTVPVHLELLAVNPVAMAADRERPSFYLLHRLAQTADNSELLIIDADSERLVRRHPVGTDASDLTVSYAEDRLYIGGTGSTRLQVIDLTTQELLPPITTGAQTAQVAAGRAGRIYQESTPNWINIAVVDTSSGAVVSWFPGSIYNGEGLVHPSGDLYFHAESGSLLKFDIATDAVSLVAEGHGEPYPTTTLVMTREGRRLFWAGIMMNDDLEVLEEFEVIAQAVNSDGSLLITDNAVIDTATGQWVDFLPFATTVMAVAPDDRKVLLADPLSGTVTSLALPQPSSVFADGFASGSTALWSDVGGGP